jgi:hypothetical protein
MGDQWVVNGSRTNSVPHCGKRSRGRLFLAFQAVESSHFESLPAKLDADRINPRIQV